MLVYTLDVRFTENQRENQKQTSNATSQNVSDRVDVLKKEILNTLFFHTIANDDNESRNEQKESVGGRRRVKTRKRQKKTKTRKRQKKTKTRKTIKKKYLK